MVSLGAAIITKEPEIVAVFPHMTMKAMAPPASAACINAGGADKTIAYRRTYPRARSVA